MYKTDNKGIKKKEKMRLINFRLLLNSVTWVIGIFQGRHTKSDTFSNKFIVFYGVPEIEFVKLS